MQALKESDWNEGACGGYAGDGSWPRQLIVPEAGMRRFLLSVTVLLLLAVGALAESGVDDIVRADMEKRHVPGLALAVIRNGQVVHAKGYGLANVEWQAPVTPETIFPIASVSKQFVAAGILLLVEDGKL